MGTRADFYIGVRNPRWIGSLSKDGFPWDIPCRLLIQTNKVGYEESVCEYLKIKNGVIPSEGDKWPWPWPDSRLSDYSYFFSLTYGKVFAYSMVDSIVFDPLKIVQGEDLHTARISIIPTFPQMMEDKYGSKIAKAI
jgi:hypothetical protein